ncbi:ATP-binding cassette domain-containing protein [Gottfriedia acidiceleris]|uniref:ATP-binding cassette domain-containing protein n=1 Tax=Gottfriedia acidiceleris TaxID=371036 RepID=UPI002FFE08C2
MFELKINGLKKYMDATLVLKNITFEAYEGDKIGIIGINGSGKSTILKIIAGILPMNYYPGYPQTSSYGYDEGLINFVPKGLTSAYLEQTPVYPKGLKVIDVLNMAFDEVIQIENQMRELEDQMNVLENNALERAMKRYSDLVQLFEVYGGYQRDEKLGKVCTGLKFEESFLNRDFDLLSGGEKTTVLLGKLLINSPDILLLDEPTNHLDIDSIETLEEALDEFKGTIFFISHDRYFINKMSQRVIAIEDYELKSYLGNYDDYKGRKEKISFKETKDPVAKKGIRKKVNNKDDNNQEKIKAEALVKIERFEKEINEIDLAMNSEQDYHKLNDLYCRKIELSKDLESAMELWLAL